MLSVTPYRTVLRSTLPSTTGDCTPVVVKLCNRAVASGAHHNNDDDADADDDGMHVMMSNTVRDEVRAYSLLATRCAKQVFDVAVPRLLAWNGTAAVVRRVGFGLRHVGVGCDEAAGKRSAGMTIVRVSSDRDVNGIRQAACVALRTLHENGVVHGKVALRHVRVRKREEGEEAGEDNVPAWKAWWVDLSRTRMVGGGLAIMKRKRNVGSYNYEDDEDGDDEEEDEDECAMQTARAAMQHEMQRVHRLFSRRWLALVSDDDDRDDGEGGAA